MDILIVDGDSSFAMSVHRLIQPWGHRADRSETGRKALRMVRKKMFDLVLLNALLPDTKAPVLIEKLKELRPEMGICTMTEYNDEKLEGEIRELGIIYYMSKPFRREELKSILDHISKRRVNQ